MEAFIARWGTSAGAERANYQLFLAELCDLLGVPRPDPSVADEAANRYVFDKAVTFQNPDGKTSTGCIDLSGAARRAQPGRRRRAGHGETQARQACGQEIDRDGTRK
jgi:hypothetical protein